MRTIYIDTEVEIDLSEVVSELSDSELIDEVIDRGIELPVSTFEKHVDTEYLIELLCNRSASIVEADKIKDALSSIQWL